MNRFWKRFIRPVIELTKPKTLLEIGAAAGLNTRNLLAYCRETGAHIDIIDPVPAPELSGLLDEYKTGYSYFRSKSIEAIPGVAAPDIALIDGDHNWYTVFTELTLLFTRSSQLGAKPPITFHHDVCWPYARRDMYYNPEDLDPANRHPYAYRGIIPGRSELADEGLNDYLANAMHEGGPQNGVMTAIEDFIASAGMPISVHVLPFFHGLSILIPEQRQTTALAQLIEGFFSSESLLESCKALEEDGNCLRVDLATTHIRLLKRTEALERARRLLIP